MPDTGALGWLRDLPDHRDLHPGHPAVKSLIEALPRAERDPPGLPDRIDWREFCPPITDQRAQRSCSAHACVGLWEYFQRRAFGNLTRYSRPFVYTTSRRLLHITGDNGCGLRATLRAIALFGVPPEGDCAQDPGHCDADPDSFVYSTAIRIHPLHYVRLDPPGVTCDRVLNHVQWFLASGFPIAFGFPVTNLLGDDGDILLPRPVDSCLGGLSVLAVGYDTSRRVGGSLRGALLVRNSWGARWGEDGYGWLPFEYVLRGLAVDYWTVLAPDWLGSHEFTQPEK